MKIYKLTNRIIVAAIGLCVFGAFVCDTDAFARSRKEKEKKIKYVRSKYALKGLIELGKAKGQMAKVLNKETKNYKKVVKGIEEGKITKGLSADDVRKKYGDPVITLADEEEGREEWIYKPGSESYSSVHKIYLVFNEERELVEWRSAAGKK